MSGPQHRCEGEPSGGDGMKEDAVQRLHSPAGMFPTAQVLRKGARALLAQAAEAEVATLLSRYAEETTDDGRQRLSSARSR